MDLDCIRNGDRSKYLANGVNGKLTFNIQIRSIENVCEISAAEIAILWFVVLGKHFG